MQSYTLFLYKHFFLWHPVKNNTFRTTTSTRVSNCTLLRSLLHISFIIVTKWIPAARCKEILVFTYWVGLWSILWTEMPTSLYKFFFGFLKSPTFYIMICYSFTTQGDCKISNFKSLNAPFFWVEMYCPCQKHCKFISQYKNKSCVWFFGCYFVIEMFKYYC